MALGPDNRYIVQSMLGEGVFGRVLRCRDRLSRELVAVKVAAREKRPQKQARREADVLIELERRDRDVSWRYFPRLLETFVHENQGICLVFQPLAMCLQELLKSGGAAGLFLKDIQAIGRQLSSGLAFMHGFGVAHTDIKCTNVMIRDDAFEVRAHPRWDSPAEAPCLDRPVEAVLIDFGGAAAPPLLDGNTCLPPEHTRPGVRVGARQIRAPEVVLGLDWSVVADMWSLGCMLMSLYTGERLFKVHNDMEHLAMMERLVEARVPAEMSRLVGRKILDKGVFFDDRGCLDWPGSAGSDAVEKVECMLPLRDQILPRHSTFLHHVRSLLALRPEDRIHAADALKTSFARTFDIVE